MKRKYVLTAAILTVILSLCGCDRANNNSESKPETVSDPIISQISSENISSVSPTVKPEQSAPSSEVDSMPENSVQSKILIAYFTWAENIESNSDVDATASASVLLPGNVGQMAAWIQTEIGGDLFSIQVNEPYSSDYDECLDRAADEKAQKARPALKTRLKISRNMM